MGSSIIDEVASVLLDLSLADTDTAIITSIATVLVELDLVGCDQE